MLQAGYAGSVITGGVAILDALLHKSPAAGYSPKGYYPDHDKSYYPEQNKYDTSYPYESPKPYHDTLFQGQSGQTRRLQQGGFPEELVPGRGGFQNTGNKVVQVCPPYALPTAVWQHSVLARGPCLSASHVAADEESKSDTFIITCLEATPTAFCCWSA